MRIEIRGRNMEVTDELREHVRNASRGSRGRCRSWRRSRSSFARSATPRSRDRYVAEANLHLKGATIHAEEASPEMLKSIHELSEDVRRQVKRHREKRRARAKTRRALGGHQRQQLAPGDEQGATSDECRPGQSRRTAPSSTGAL